MTVQPVLLERLKVSNTFPLKPIFGAESLPLSESRHTLILCGFSFYGFSLWSV